MFAHPSSLATGSVDVNDDYNNTGGTRLATQPESSCCPASAKLERCHSTKEQSGAIRDRVNELDFARTECIFSEHGKAAARRCRQWG
uniref:Uncharacterized protein n=1 Tax=Vespula pensylvanica TaxID=30213 RepID=A0A834UD29_VESPE|nr:hypothetical protein H0235_004640 [Vespula pensylvanica]